MAERQGFLEYDSKKQINRFYVFDKKTANISFAPEIKWTEDMEVISLYGWTLDEGSPIMIRCNHWDLLMDSINIPSYTDETQKIRGISPELLINKHSFLFYEPPELFQFSYPQILISQALGSDPLALRRFKAKSKKFTDRDKINKVLDELPRFYRPFAEKQFHKYLLFHTEDEDLPMVAKKIFDEKELKKRPNISTVWTDERIDASYPIHIAELLLEANKANKAKNSALIPPVPKLNRSSSNTDIELVKDFNLSASTVRNTMLSDKYPHIYMHLYLDWKMTQPKASGLNAKSLLPFIEKTIEEGDFSGICLTIKGYKNAVEKGKFEYIESFVTDLSSLAEYYYLPLILPRSKWYGIKLSDCSINCFGSLLNGKDRYTRRTKGFKTREDVDGKKIDLHLEYGYTYIINECVELDYDDTKQYVERNKGFPDVNHLPKIIKKDYWNNSRLFRINVSKARRLSHMEEARYIRKGRKNNVINPAARYLERSKNPDFGAK